MKDGPGWKISLGQDWAHGGTERKLKLFDRTGPLTTVEHFIERLQRAKIKLRKQGDSAANLVETYIVRVQAAQAKYQNLCKMSKLKNDANINQAEVLRLRAEAGEYDILSQAP